MKNLSGVILNKKYNLIQPIGKGGMGTVYLTRDIKLDCFWAIKIIEKQSDSTEDLLAEPNLLKKLEHPSLPRITDIIEDEQYLYIVMDFIDGRGLDILIKENHAIDEETAVRWGKELCNVLIYLHSQKPHPIIYRDMKPSNVIITKDGHVKLIDFGIAREYKKEAITDTIYLGTRGFAAPEQYKDSSNKLQTDERTDIYGLGVTLYNMLTGKRPDEPPYEIKPLREMNSKLSEGIEHIVAKCTQIDPKLRYQNVSQLLYDLNNIEKIGRHYKYKQLIKFSKSAACLLCILGSGFLIFNGWSTYKNASAAKYSSIIKDGRKLVSNMKYDNAINKFKEAQNFDSGKKEAYFEIAKTYMSMWSLDDSLRYLDRLNQINSNFQNDDYLKYLMGKIYFLKCNYKMSQQYFSQIKDASKVDSDYNCLNDLSDQITQKTPQYDKLKQNLNEFEKYIDKSVDDGSVKLNLYISASDMYIQLESLIDPRNSKERMNNLNKQLEILKKAESIDTSNYTVIDRMASVYREQARNIRFSDKENYEKSLLYSLDKYSKCLSLQQSVDIYKNIGDIYTELNKYKEAENAYDSIIKINPDNYIGYLQMASLYFTKGDSNKAKEYLAKAENSKHFINNNPLYVHLRNSLQ
ncbi:protein kinase domain-containing protein [Inconstantimicrobium porci]|uniref:protein kinase domain-containing protein n=1 Tax=Inconstantimicrobium porci TaxID=2652291 RepID=UPI002409452D|nr:protein kinase [Inconstantimicrobium porci]MDD6769383.1 protein kinase [Inconstantimicrobium porci]